MPNSTPSQVGPYKIEEEIGAGGMGKVFRATDTRLQRTVAVKISEERFSERFEREARVIAQLNHPNICTIHDVGPNYIVMEFISGETLDARLRKGPLPLEQILRYGAQIASALAAAHARGIVHRDLKPGNIMLTKTGAKVLDFGLAKMATDETLTIAGAVLGTPAYMAPEQREGKEADHRTDIYALGLVLRKMATGKRETPVMAPPHFGHVVEQCLARDPGERWQSAADIQKELEWTAVAPAETPGTHRAVKGSLLPWAVAVVALAGLSASSLALFRARRSSMEPSEFNISLERQDGRLPVPSPDDHVLAFRGLNANHQPMIFLRSVNSVQARALEGTEGTGTTIFWSPNSEWIGFFSGGAMKKIKVSGGPAFTIAEMRDLQDADWGPGGNIIFRPTNREPLQRVSDAGGAPQPLTLLDEARRENSHRFPQFLPDGRHFLFVARCAERANNAAYMGSLDSKELKRVMPAQSRVSYIPGALLSYRDGSLIAQQFDVKSGKLSGEPIPVVSKIGYMAPSIYASFRASTSGKLILYGTNDGVTSRFVWFGRDGEELGTMGGMGAYNQPRLSPAGDRLAFDMPDPRTGNRDVYYMEIGRDITHPLTSNVANDWYPVWSPDGKQVMFGSDRADGRTMLAFLKTSLDESSPEIPFKGLDQPTDWSRDGQWILAANHSIWAAPVQAGDKFQVAGGKGSDFGARFAPDAKWLAYSSDESGRSEIYVRRFTRQSAEAGEKIQVSINGGEYPVWNSAGSELYYMSGDNSIYGVDVRGLGGGVQMTAPVKLFRACPGRRPPNPAMTGQAYANQFDTHDGQRFLVVCLAEPPDQFTALMNWAGIPH
jgi:eukaryotic-like serine/threonine-protein kinase